MKKYIKSTDGLTYSVNKIDWLKDEFPKYKQICDIEYLGDDDFLINGVYFMYSYSQSEMWMEDNRKSHPYVYVKDLKVAADVAESICDELNKL